VDALGEGLDFGKLGHASKSRRRASQGDGRWLAPVQEDRPS
jgi:hypothetical protein